MIDIRKAFIRFWIWLRCIKIVQFNHSEKYAIQKGWFFYKYYCKDATCYKWYSSSDTYDFPSRGLYDSIQYVCETYYSCVDLSGNVKAIYVEVEHE